MPPRTGPAVPAASRRAKRVIESTSPSPSNHPEEAAEEDELDDEEDEEDDGMELDAEGEEYESEEEDVGAVTRFGVSSVIASEDMELDPSPEVEPEPDPEPEPSSALRIRLKVNNESRRPSRAAAKKSGKRTKRVALEAAMGSDEEEALFEQDPAGEEEIDELDVMSYAGSSRRSASPSKLTARQRAKGNKDLQETLIALPNEGQGKKLVLTEAERLQRREETARRRKRQSEQRLQDEQDQTINRLLRAQTGRSRSKLDGPPLLPDPATASSFDANHTIPDTRRPGPAPKEGMIRWVSSISGDNVNLRVGVPVGKENWLDVGDVGRGGGGLERRDVSGVCAVEGCKESRKYRSLKRFKVGGCCMTHLKAVEAALAGG